MPSLRLLHDARGAVSFNRFGLPPPCVPSLLNQQIRVWALEFAVKLGLWLGSPLSVQLGALQSPHLSVGILVPRPVGWSCFDHNLK